MEGSKEYLLEQIKYEMEEYRFAVEVLDSVIQSGRSKLMIDRAERNRQQIWERVDHYRRAYWMLVRVSSDASCTSGPESAIADSDLQLSPEDSS